MIVCLPRNLSDRLILGSRSFPLSPPNITNRNLLGLPLDLGRIPVHVADLGILELDALLRYRHAVEVAVPRLDRLADIRVVPLSDLV